jgi:hypothetical protein
MRILISQKEEELDIRKRKEQAQLIMYMMYVMVGFFGFYILFGFLYMDLSLIMTITYISITIILLMMLYHIQKNFLGYTITVLETRNRWSENRIELDCIVKMLYTVIGVLTLIIFAQIIQIEVSPIFFVIILTLLIMIWLLFLVKKYEKKLAYWESKSYHDLTFEETIKKLERIFIKNNIKYYIKENINSKFFTFDRYDYLFEIEQGTQLKIFFPIKKKSKFYPALNCYIQIGPKNLKKKVNLSPIKSLLDTVLEEN